jgi:hypothetical protein
MTQSMTASMAQHDSYADDVYAIYAIGVLSHWLTASMTQAANNRPATGS